MTVLIEDSDSVLTWQDCLDYLGPEGMAKFTQARKIGNQRIGQAWFNALFLTYPVEANKLIGSFEDPFYRDSQEDVIRALQFLLNQKGDLK